MAETKQLVLVVESTSALEPYWPTIVSDYLEKIIRAFCGDEDMILDSPTVELGLVNFNVRGPFSSNWLVQKSSLIKSMETFLRRLSAIDFSSYGFCHAAIAEGLSEALMMFPYVNRNQNHQRHCILVAASNPHPLPTSVNMPPIDSGMTSESHNFDAETVAKYFKQCGVSLSVISPKQLRKLKAIYNAAKRNPLETDTPIDIVKNKKYLVLISEDFMDARDALSQPEFTNLPSYHDQSPTIIDLTQDFYPGTPPTLDSPEIGLVPIEQRVLEKISTTPVKEPSTTSSMASAQTCSPLSTSQEMTSSRNANMQKPTPVGVATILNNLSKSHLLRCGNSNISNIISRDMMPFVPITQTITSTRQAESANLANLTGTSTGSTMLTNVVNDNMATIVDPTQQTLSALQSQPLEYIKLWEGDLTVERNRHTEPVIVTRLEGYKETKACESLAKDWPSKMQVDTLISCDYMKHMKYTGKADYLIFRALNEHQFLVNLQQNNLCGVIKLPSQVLLLSVSDKVNLLYGMVVPQEMVKYEPQQDHQGQDSSQGKQSMISIN